MADLDVNVNPNPKDATHLAKGKTVQFHTTADCRLHFTNPAVFNQDVRGSQDRETTDAHGSERWLDVMGGAGAALDV